MADLKHALSNNISLTALKGWSMNKSSEALYFVYFFIY